MSKNTWVEDDTLAALSVLKGDDETFDEVLSRLIRERHETVREGDGLWEGTDDAKKAGDMCGEMTPGGGSH